MLIPMDIRSYVSATYSYFLIPSSYFILFILCFLFRILPPYSYFLILLPFPYFPYSAFCFLFPYFAFPIPLPPASPCERRRAHHPPSPDPREKG